MRGRNKDSKKRGGLGRISSKANRQPGHPSDVVRPQRMQHILCVEGMELTNVLNHSVSVHHARLVGTTSSDFVLPIATFTIIRRPT